MLHLVLHFRYLTAAGKAGTYMSDSNAFSHLTLEERRIILTGIVNGSTKTAIAKTIGKDKSTIGKEIKIHRALTHKCRMPLECNNFRKCAFGRQCTLDCPGLSPFRCPRRDRSPGACNGCLGWTRCRFDKYQYCPEDAHRDYRAALVDSRGGVNLTSREAEAMAAVINPLFRLLQATRNWAFLKRPFITISKMMCSMKLPALLSWTCAARYPAGPPKRSPRLTKSGQTVNI